MTSPKALARSVTDSSSFFKFFAAKNRAMLGIINMININAMDVCIASPAA